MILTKSYRSTKQIIQLTSKILNDGSEVEALTELALNHRLLSCQMNSN